jgi:hypothetical protein
VLLLPDRGAAIFAFANRTYAGPSHAVWDAAVMLDKGGYFQDREIAVSAELARAYRAIAAIYAKGDVAVAADQLAMNFLMDRDAAGWRKDLADLHRQVGDCDTTAPVTAEHALAGQFTWRCAHGRLKGSVLLAPTVPPRIQSLELAVAGP